MIETLYRFLLRPLLSLSMRLLSFVSPKIRAARLGRSRWRDQIASIPARSAIPRIHWHVASVGECEQALPVMRLLAEQTPAPIQTLSYSSPSLSRAIAKHPDRTFSRLSAITYAPHESRRDSEEFIDRIDPDLLLLVRYDLWPAMLSAARRRGASIVLICGVIHPGTPRLRWYARPFFRWIYGMLDVASMVSERDAVGVRTLVSPATDVRVDGDTRYDRVIERAQSECERVELELIRAAAVGRTVVVAGSTWREDEEVLTDVIADREMLTVIVPHEPTPDVCRELKSSAPDTFLISELLTHDPATICSLTIGSIIVDATGYLAECYAVAAIAYIGGGFGSGVHSVLEAAAHSCVLISGPRIGRSPDATELQASGLLNIVRTRRDCTTIVAGYRGEPRRMREEGERSLEFVRERSGATQRLADLIRERANQQAPMSADKSSLTDSLPAR
jgi:3-deoxy-D-manno-octulosonic-acid transferase